MNTHCLAPYRPLVAPIIAGLLCTVWLTGGSPANAGVIAEPLPDGDKGSCELHAYTPRQVVELIYTNVVKTSRESLDDMEKHVSPDIVFSDPVSAAKGWPAYRKVYEQFIGAEQLYYKIDDWSCSGRTVYIHWVFGMKNQHTSNQYVEFEGVSKMVLDASDRIVLNRDNWNEVPPGYAGSLRSGDKGGVELK